MMNAEELLILHELILTILCSLSFSYEFRKKAQMITTFQSNFNTDTKKCISSYQYCKGSTQGLTSLGMSDPGQRSFKFFWSSLGVDFGH